MKKIHLIFATGLALVFFSCAFDTVVEGGLKITTGQFTDTRDGKIYKTVTIGTQTWMAQNLDYKTANSKCYDDDFRFCDNTYGSLYNWEDANTACPTGWHLSSSAEWETLYNYLGGEYRSLDYLKKGTAFNAWLGGYYDESNYRNISATGYWWTSDRFNNNWDYECNDNNECFEVFNYYRNYQISTYISNDNKHKNNLLSVRCLKD